MEGLAQQAGGTRFGLNGKEKVLSLKTAQQ